MSAEGSVGHFRPRDSKLWYTPTFSTLGWTALLRQSHFELEYAIFELHNIPKQFLLIFSFFPDLRSSGCVAMLVGTHVLHYAFHSFSYSLPCFHLQVLAHFGVFQESSSDFPCLRSSRDELVLLNRKTHVSKPWRTTRRFRTHKAMKMPALENSCGTSPETPVRRMFPIFLHH
jgi:hypothetical protein